MNNEQKDTVYHIRLRPTKGKKIYVDPLEREGVYLYPSEIDREKVEDRGNLSEEELERLRTLYALPRAKKRSFGILAKQDQTKDQIIKKLRQSYIDRKTLEETVAYLEECAYIDDEKYVRNYLSDKRKKKSFRQIRYDLSKKGIERELLDRIFDENDRQSQDDLRILFERYVRRFAVFDIDASHKTYQHFVRKGYDSDLIRSMIREKKHIKML